MAFGALKGTLQVAANSITNPFSLTGSVAVNRGDLVYAVITEQTSMTTTSVGDNLGNNYVSTQTGVDAGTVTAIAFWATVQNSGTLTAVNATCTASGDNAVGLAAVFEGPFSGIDANPTIITSDITSPFAAPATGTLTQSNELVVSFMSPSYATALTASSPMTMALQSVTQTVAEGALSYNKVSATTSVVPNFSAATNPAQNILGTNSFKGASDFPSGAQVFDLPPRTLVTPRPSPPGWINQPLTFTFTPPAPPAAPYMPCVVTDWGIPDTPKPTPQWQVPPNIALTAPVTVAVAQPFAQYAWPPAPVRPPAPTWSPAPNIALMAPGAVVTAPFAQSQWPTPPRPPATPTWSPPNIAITVPAAAVTIPFSQSSWPPPQRPPATPAWFAPNIVITAPTAAPQPPIAQYQWPTPARPPAASSWFSSPNIALTAPTAPVAPVERPFSQYGWPLPPSPRATLPFAPPNIALTAPVAPTPPAAQFMPCVVVNWPTPEPPRATPTWQVPPNIALLSGEVVIEYVLRAPTFTPRIEAPPPVGKSGPLGSFRALLDTPSGPPPPKPFAQTSWPTPAPPPARYSYAQPTPLTLYPQPPPVERPFAQYFWPLPAPPPARFAYVQPTPLTLYPQPAPPPPQPFAQYTWPTPLPPPARYTNYTQGTPLTLYPQPLPPPPQPFAQYAWPPPPPPPARFTNYTQGTPLTMFPPGPPIDTSEHHDMPFLASMGQLKSW